MGSEKNSILQSFGRYFLLDEIAEGGMAVIYRARLSSSEGAGKFVAIKRIRKGLQKDAQFLQMFRSEIRAMMGLSHPNVVQLYDFGEDDGQPYFVMEYVDGKSLREVMNRFTESGNAVPIEVAINVIEQAATGLAYAHAFKDKITNEPLNLVHRDISPQNIVISYDGTVKLIDFGIAKASSNLESTRTGLIKGKVHYLSPEQIRGETLDGRSDVFALGVVLWETLTGHKLFTGKNEYGVIQKIQQGVMPSNVPSVHNLLIPKELDEVVMKAVALNPEDRFQDAQDFQRALRRIQQKYYPEFDMVELGTMMHRNFELEIHGDRAWLAENNLQAERILAQTRFEEQAKARRGPQLPPPPPQAQPLLPPKPPSEPVVLPASPQEEEEATTTFQFPRWMNAVTVLAIAAFFVSYHWETVKSWVGPSAIKELASDEMSRSPASSGRVSQTEHGEPLVSEASSHPSPKSSPAQVQAQPTIQTTLSASPRPSISFHPASTSSPSHTQVGQSVAPAGARTSDPVRPVHASQEKVARPHPAPVPATKPKRRLSPNQLNSSLILALKKGNTEELEKLMKEYSLSSNHELKGGRSLLMYAAGIGQDESVRYLILKGAAVNAVSPDRNTALTLAIQGNRESVVRLLLISNANKEHRTKSGDNALDLARRLGRKSIVKMLDPSASVAQSAEAPRKVPTASPIPPPAAPVRRKPAAVPVAVPAPAAAPATVPVPSNAPPKPERTSPPATTKPQTEPNKAVEHPGGVFLTWP